MTHQKRTLHIFFSLCRLYTYAFTNKIKSFDRSTDRKLQYERSDVNKWKREKFAKVLPSIYPSNHRRTFILIHYMAAAYMQSRNHFGQRAKGVQFGELLLLRHLIVSLSNVFPVLIFALIFRSVFSMHPISNVLAFSMRYIYTYIYIFHMFQLVFSPNM